MKTATTAKLSQRTSTKDRVLRMLYWDELQYGQFQYKMGLRYLKNTLLGGDDTWLDELSRSKIFWQWWINQWNMRDQAFVQDAENICNGQVSTMIDKYMGTHDPAYLNVHPHKTVMEETYAVMMQQFIDETMKQPC